MGGIDKDKDKLLRGGVSINPVILDQRTLYPGFFGYEKGIPGFRHWRTPARLNAVQPA